MAESANSEDERSRSGSISRKRKKEEEDDTDVTKINDEELEILDAINEIILTETNKVIKGVARAIQKKVQELAAISCRKGLEIANLRGRLSEKEEFAEVYKKKEETSKVSYAGAVRSFPALPRVGKKQIAPRDVETVVLVYPADEKIQDSEETKKLVKSTIKPKAEGIQIRAVRKIQKGGLVIESGSRNSAQKFREIANKNEAIRTATPKKIMPKVMIYDIDRDLTEEEISDYIYQQNIAEHGVPEEKMKEEFKIIFKTGRRELPTANIVVEVSPRIREILLTVGRVFIDYDSCRVVDHLHITRCFKCQGYGHSSKFCKKPGPDVCSHCGRAGHGYEKCPRIGEKPSCANCMAAKRPCDHRVGSMECPMYKRLVEQRATITYYG